MNLESETSCTKSNEKPDVVGGTGSCSWGWRIALCPSPVVFQSVRISAVASKVFVPGQNPGVIALLKGPHFGGSRGLRSPEQFLTPLKQM